MQIEYKVVGISEFRKDMKILLDWLNSGDRVRVVTIAKHSKVVAYLVSPPLYQGLLNAEATLEELITLESNINREWERTGLDRLMVTDENKKGGIDG